MTEIRLPLTGGCLCGACRYEVRAAPLTVYACHCTDCQRQSGSAFGMTMIVRRTDLALTAGEPTAYVRDMPGGRLSTIRFCGTCGSRLYAEANAEYAGVRPGTLDDTSWLKPAPRNWTKSGHGWAMADDTPVHPTQPENLAEAVRLWRKQGLRFVQPPA